MHAVRNVRLCTKDCLCLYVCPTGATDTETGQIDAATCLNGCRACVDACPSHAISLVPETFPAQQEKSVPSANALISLAKSKTEQEHMAASLARTAEQPGLKMLAEALQLSNRLMAEDLIREAGYLLPQSKNVQQLLKMLLDSETSEDFPRRDAEWLLNAIKQNNN